MRFNGLWRHRDFMRFWTGQTISMFGSLIGKVALPLTAVLLLDATPAQMSLIRTAELLPGVLVGLWAGLWVDRMRRRPLMIYTDLGRFLLIALIPLMAFSGHLRIGHMVLVAMGVSLLTVVFDVAYEAYLPTLVTRDALVEANAKIQATGAIAEVTGFGMAGAMVQLLTGPVTLLIDALSFLASALNLMRIRSPEPAPKPAESREGSLQEIKAGLQVVVGNPILLALTGASAIRSLFMSVIGVLLYLYLSHTLQLEPTEMGLLFAIGGVVSLVGAMLAPRVLKRFGLGPTLIGMALLATAGALCLPLAAGPFWLILLFLAGQQVLADGALTIMAIAEVSLRQKITPDEILGRVNASVRVADWGAMLIGTLLGGVLGELVSLRTGLWVAGLGQLLGVAWLWLSPVRRLREG